MPKREIFVSIDVEADGPIPGQNSMLQLGAAAFDLEADDPRRPVSKFRVNLEELEGAVQDPGTMEWWSKQGDAYDKTRLNMVKPDYGMEMFARWLAAVADQTKGKLVVAGYPVTYDFMWAYWYFIRFRGFPAPFGFQGLDMKTLAMSKLGCQYRESAKRRFPKTWFEGAPEHTHDAEDDAVGQGVMFVNMVREEGPDPARMQSALEEIVRLGKCFDAKGTHSERVVRIARKGLGLED